MKIEVNIGKRHLVAFVACLFLFAGAFFAIAYTYDSVDTSASEFGHSADEVDIEYGNLTYSLEESMGVIASKLCLFGVNGPSCAGGDLDGEMHVVHDFVPGTYESSESANVIDVPAEYHHPGIHRVTPTGMSYLVLGSTHSNDYFDVTYVFRSSASVAFGASGETFFVGLYGRSSYSSGDVVSRIGFRIAGSFKNWTTVTAVSTSEATNKNTSVSLGAAKQWFKFRILRSNDGQISFYINDQLVSVHDTSIPLDEMTAGVISDDYTYEIDLFKMIVSDLGSRYSYSMDCGSPLFDSMSGGIAAKPGWVELNVPAACTQGIGCVIKQELYSSKSGVVPSITRQYEYKQYVTGTGVDKWTSSYISGSTRNNGDTASSNVIPNYNDNNILLRDDYSSTLITEKSSAKWIARDVTASYGTKIYVCTYDN